MSAVAALPSVTGGESDAGGMTARVRAIIAQADELTDAERGELLRHLQGAANGKADAKAVDCVPLLESEPHADAGDAPTDEQADEQARTVAA